MKSGVPWSVKGVEPEAREAAKAKARRAGLTLGAWLNQVIRDSGGIELADSEMRRWVGDDDDDAVPGPDLTAINERIATLERLQSEANQEIEQALETLAVRIAKTPARPGAPDPGLNERLAKIESEGQKRIERLSREIGMLANRYSDVEAQFERNRQEIAEQLERTVRRGPVAGDPGLAKIQSTLAGMEGRLETVSKEARSAATTFEQALRAVMERVVHGEKRQHEQAHGFESALEGLTGRIQQLVERDETEAVRGLEKAVGEITEHFETIEKRRERASRAVEDAIRNLTERLAESDKRHGEQVQAPLDALDNAVQSITAQIEQTDNRAETAMTVLGTKLEQNDARTQSAVSAIGKRLQDSEERVKGTFAAISKRLQDSDERAQSAFAAIEAQIQAQDHQGQDTLAAIDTRLSDIAERVDQNDTEAKASRLALMRALDETRKRVGKLEDRPYYVAEPPSLQAEETAPEPEPASSFASFVHTEEPGEELAEDAAPPVVEEPLETVFDLDRMVESGQGRLDRSVLDQHDEPSPYSSETPEEPPPFKTAEPVWALLAAARAAARAEAAQPPVPEDEADPGMIDFSPRAYESDSRPVKAKRQLSRPLLISALILLIIAFSAWQISKLGGQDGSGRPGFIRSVIESLHETTPPKPENTAPAPKSGSLSRGAPAPILPSATPVPERPVAAVPTAPAPDAKNTPNPLATAKLEPAPAKDDAARKAIDAVRDARSAEEKESAAAQLTTAAEAGDSAAQFTLGRLYETGRGVKINLTTAHDWYQKAADQGHIAAAFNLGMLEAQGGTREGYDHAARWFDLAARQGLADAQFNLGMLYAQGLGVDRDPVEAFAWFSAAAAQGDAGAAAERDRISQGLDDAARARGEALAHQRGTPAKNANPG
jgi:localization factor PodJL